MFVVFAVLLSFAASSSASSFASAFSFARGVAVRVTEVQVQSNQSDSRGFRDWVELSSVGTRPLDSLRGWTVCFAATCTTIVRDVGLDVGQSAVVSLAFGATEGDMVHRFKQRWSLTTRDLVLGANDLVRTDGSLPQDPLADLGVADSNVTLWDAAGRLASAVEWIDAPTPGATLAFRHDGALLGESVPGVRGAYASRVIPQLPPSSFLDVGSPCRYVYPVTEVVAGPADGAVTDVLSAWRHVYFAADGQDGFGRELWFLAGPPGRATRLGDLWLHASGSSPAELVEFDGRLVFAATSGLYGRELHVFDWQDSRDEAVVDARMLVDLLPGVRGSDPRFLTVRGGERLFFVATAPSVAGERREILSIPRRGEGVGEGILVHWEPPPPAPAFLEDEDRLVESDRDGFDDPEDLFVFRPAGEPPSHDGHLVFTAVDGVHGREIWVAFARTPAPAPFPQSEPLVTGLERPVRLADLAVGAGGSNAGEWTAFSGALVFAADDGGATAGRELWAWTGRRADVPVLLSDVCPGSCASTPASLTVLGPKLYFAATHPTFGRELFFLDSWSALPAAGRTLRANLVADLEPAAGVGSDPGFLTAYAGSLFFVAEEASVGRELWQFDGANTPFIAWEAIKGSGSSNPHLLVVHHHTLLFVADDGGSGAEFHALFDPRANPQLGIDTRPPHPCPSTPDHLALGPGTCAVVLTHPESNLPAGDEFGAALAVDRAPLFPPTTSNAIPSPPADLIAPELLVGSPGSDSIVVFMRAMRRRRFGWTSTAVLRGAPGSRIGAAIAIHQGVLVAGSVPTATAVLWRRSMHETWTHEAALTPSSPNPFAAFGSSVAIWDELVAVGAPGGAGVVGRVFLFRRAPATAAFAWTQFRVLDGSNEGFGTALSFADGTLLVGDPEDQSAAGLVHIFVWDVSLRDFRRPLVPSLRPLDSHAGQQFGAALSVDGIQLVVGAPGADDLDAGPDAGAAYIFTLPAPGVVERTIQDLKLVGRDAQAGDGRGSAVAAGAAPAQVLVGGPLPAGSTRASEYSSLGVFVFEPARPSTFVSDIEVRWPQRAKLRPNQPIVTAAARFGAALVTLGAASAIGAPGDGNATAGAVFVTECPTPACRPGFFAFQTCTAGSDRECRPCARGRCPPGSFEARSCTPAHDRSCQRCTECTGAQNVTQARCTLTTDTICAAPEDIALAPEPEPDLSITADLCDTRGVCPETVLLQPRRPPLYTRDLAIEERRELVALYHAAGGPDWILRWTDLLDQDPCRGDWPGVECRGGHVFKLCVVTGALVSFTDPIVCVHSTTSLIVRVCRDLRRAHLHGELPATFGSRLPFLRVLYVMRSSVHRSVRVGLFSRCVRSSRRVRRPIAPILLRPETSRPFLVHLRSTATNRRDLAENFLTGHIPTTIPRMASLEVLCVRGRRDHGTHLGANDVTLARSIRILRRDLSDNQFSGPTPVHFWTDIARLKSMCVAQGRSPCEPHPLPFSPSSFSVLNVFAATCVGTNSSRPSFPRSLVAVQSTPVWTRGPDRAVRAHFGLWFCCACVVLR